METIGTALSGFLLFQGLLLSALFFRKAAEAHKSAFLLTSSLLVAALILHRSLAFLNLLLEESELIEVPLPPSLPGILVLLYLLVSRDRRALSGSETLLFSVPVILLLLHFIPLSIEQDGLFLSLEILFNLACSAGALDTALLKLGEIGLSDFFSLALTFMEGAFIFIPAWFILFSRESDAFAPPVRESQAGSKYIKNLLPGPPLPGNQPT